MYQYFEQRNNGETRLIGILELSNSPFANWQFFIEYQLLSYKRKTILQRIRATRCPVAPPVIDRL
jgi:hypothetical protein